MLKQIRKHNKWLMVAFGVLLMFVWLGNPAIDKANQSISNKVVAKLDGRSVRLMDQHLAAKELHALADYAPMLTRGDFGIDDRDTTHWFLLAEEARAGGFVGEAEDGRQYLDRLAVDVIQREARQNFQLLGQLFAGDNPPKTYEEAIARGAAAYASRAPQVFRQHHLTHAEMDHALAKASGVVRMMNSYSQAGRLSRPRVVARARERGDSAVIEYAFLPASALAPQVPDPDEAALRAHFDRFKDTRPGEGDFGIGYLLPPRVRLEWLTLDRAAIEAAITPDAVEVVKRHRQHRDKYPGELAAERANVERDMRTELADRILADARQTVQAEVGRATRRLERDGPAGRYRKLPEDWEASRPRLEAIAPVVVEQTARAHGVTIPLPAVTIKGEWVTLSEAGALPGIGRSTLRQGGLDMPFPSVLSWTRDLGGEGLAPVQAGVPFAENYLIDAAGNRYHFTVLETRGESPPDSVEEIREQAVADYKNVQAFEMLRARAEELRAAAIAGGIEAAASTFAAGANAERPEVNPASTVSRGFAESAELRRDEAIRATIMDAADTLDPMTPPDQHPVDRATLAIPSSKAMGLVLARVRAFVPVTQEDFRDGDRDAANRVKQDELSAAHEREHPFSLDALLRRHVYQTGDERIRSRNELNRLERDEVAG